MDASRWNFLESIQRAVLEKLIFLCSMHLLHHPLVVCTDCCMFVNVSVVIMEASDASDRMRSAWFCTPSDGDLFDSSASA